MDWSQLLYAGLLTLATVTGGGRIASVMWLNFIATMALAIDPVAVGVADAIAAAILLHCGRRGQIVAVIYAVMIPIYPIMTHAGLPNSATYTIIDVLAFIQLAVMGGWDHGLRRGVRFVSGRSSDILRPVEVRGDTAFDTGLSETEGGRR